MYVGTKIDTIQGTIGTFKKTLNKLSKYTYLIDL